MIAVEGQSMHLYEFLENTNDSISLWKFNIKYVHLF